MTKYNELGWFKDNNKGVVRKLIFKKGYGLNKRWTYVMSWGVGTIFRFNASDISTIYIPNSSYKALELKVRNSNIDLAEILDMLLTPKNYELLSLNTLSMKKISELVFLEDI